jgi:hypothetical protein
MVPGRPHVSDEERNTMKATQNIHDIGQSI